MPISFLEAAELTKEQLSELKAKLELKNKSLTKEIKDLEASLTQEDNTQDQGAPDEVDRSSFEEQVQRSQIVLAGKKNLQTEVFDALRRIDEETYGVCEETEEPIGFKRLAAQPWTRLSLEAQQDLEARNKMGRPNNSGFPSGF